MGMTDRPRRSRRRHYLVLAVVTGLVELVARSLAWAVAHVGGHSWSRCPVCRWPYGGHEHRSGGHLATIPDPTEVAAILARPRPRRGVAFVADLELCPRCTAAAAGCRAWRAVPGPIVRRQSSTCTCFDPRAAFNDLERITRT